MHAAAYRLGKEVTMDPRITAWSRRPEAGSLEQRKPGIAKAIVHVMYGPMPFYVWPHASAMRPADAARFFGDAQGIGIYLTQVIKDFNLEGADLERFKFFEDEVHRLLGRAAERYSSFNTTSKNIEIFTSAISAIQSTLFELLISTFIQGDEFYFHQDILDFYWGQNPLRRNGTRRRHFGQHEIDIVVKRHGAPDLWIEVKNNATGWTIQQYREWAAAHGVVPIAGIDHLHAEVERSRGYIMSESLIEQLQMQKDTRAKLAKENDVQILLVTKFAVPEPFSSAVRALQISTWPLYAVAQPFLEVYFHSISATEHTSAQSKD